MFLDVNYLLMVFRYLIKMFNFANIKLEIITVKKDIMNGGKVNLDKKPIVKYKGD